MEKLQVIKLLQAASRPVAGINFSDAQSAAKNALVQFFNLKDGISARDLREHKNAIFAIIEEALDEVIPKMVEDRTGDFAEIKTIARNDEARFTVRTTEASKQRLRKAIKPGARGGIYKAYRLDGNQITVKTATQSVAYMITLEELLTGQRNIAELTALLADAWIEKIYVEVFKMLQAAAADAPAVNKVTGTGTTIDNAHLDKLIAITRAYGAPVILGFPQHLALIQNNVAAGNPTRPGQDLDDLRNKGYVGMYKGTPLVELPNYIMNHGDTKVDWVFNENKIIILPANEKPVKVVFQGESYTAEVAQPHGGMEWHNHRMIGMTVIYNNFIASYELADAWATWAGI